MPETPPKNAPVPIPRENPFAMLSRMVKASLGHLPGHLVIIFFVSLVLTIFCGVMMKMAQEPADRSTYLPQRIQPEEGKEELTEAQLRGVWIYTFENYIATLKIGSGVFEVIVRSASSPYRQSFIRGGYKIVGNVLIMQERKDLGTPYDQEHFDYRFFPLSFKNINLYVERHENIMLWHVPEKELRRLDNPEPLTQLIFSPAATWVRLSSTP